MWLFGGTHVGIALAVGACYIAMSAHAEAPLVEFVGDAGDQSQRQTAAELIQQKRVEPAEGQRFQLPMAPHRSSVTSP